MQSAARLAVAAKLTVMTPMGHKDHLRLVVMAVAVCVAFAIAFTQTVRLNASAPHLVLEFKLTLIS